MRKSTVTKSLVAGLALVAALGVAGQVRAEDGGKDTKTEATKTEATKTDATKTDATKSEAAKTATKTTRTAHHHRRAEAGHRVAGPTAQTGFRIPANPLLRDCVHVAFPQCSPRGGLYPLNDGEFPLRE